MLVVFGLIHCAHQAMAEENLALYPSKGYAYTYSPLPADGLHAQASLMYSSYQVNNLECRDGEIWAMPFGLTWGDGDWVELTAASHYEEWTNTDFDVDETGWGDIFAGGKLRLLGQDRDQALDLALMPYLLFSTGDRDKGIGDLFRYNPSDADETIYGLNLLLGKRWERLYAGLNLGINYMDSDEAYVRNRALQAGLFVEYQFREELMAYLEMINVENRNTFTCETCSTCYDADIDQDIREVGAGLAWLAGKWGLKLHVGAGLSKTSPDIRTILMINRQLAYW
jgi:hypothetical protein